MNPDGNKVFCKSSNNFLYIHFVEKDKFFHLCDAEKPTLFKDITYSIHLSHKKKTFFSNKVATCCSGDTMLKNAQILYHSAKNVVSLENPIILKCSKSPNLIISNHFFCSHNEKIHKGGKSGAQISHNNENIHVQEIKSSPKYSAI